MADSADVAIFRERFEFGNILIKINPTARRRTIFQSHSHMALNFFSSYNEYGLPFTKFCIGAILPLPPRSASVARPAVLPGRHCWEISTEHGRIVRRDVPLGQRASSSVTMSTPS